MTRIESNPSIIKEALDEVVLAPLDPDGDNRDTLGMIEAMMYVAPSRDLTLTQSLIFSTKMVGSRAFEELCAKHSDEQIGFEKVGNGERHSKEFHELVLKYGSCNARSLKEHPMIVFALHETVLKELDYITSGLITEIMKEPERAIGFFTSMNTNRLAKILRVYPEEIGFDVALKVINQKKLGLNFVVTIPRLFDQVLDIMDDEGLLKMLPFLDQARLKFFFSKNPFKVMRACNYDPEILRKYVSPEALREFRRDHSLEQINKMFKDGGATYDGIQGVLGMYTQ